VPAYGFSPLRQPPGETYLDRYHGVDERVSIDGLRWGLPVLYDVVRRCGYVCERVDEAALSGSIVDQITDGIRNAELVIADLSGERPSVIHAHDWQTGLVPVFQKMHLSKDPVVGGVPAVFTIHDIAAQGVFPASTLPSIGLQWDVLDVQALEYWGQISYLKGGINFSEQITTAGTDAREVLTPELGRGMEGVLARRSNTLTGTQPVHEGHSWDASAREYVKVYRGAESKAAG